MGTVRMSMWRAQASRWRASCACSGCSGRRGGLTQEEVYEVAASTARVQGRTKEGPTMRVCSCLSSPGPQHARGELAANVEGRDSTEIPDIAPKIFLDSASARWDTKQTTTRAREVENGHDGEGRGSCCTHTSVRRDAAAFVSWGRGWMLSQSKRLDAFCKCARAAPAGPCRAMYAVCRWHYYSLSIYTWYLDGDLIPSPVGKRAWTSLMRRWAVEVPMYTMSRLDTPAVDTCR